MNYFIIQPEKVRKKDYEIPMAFPNVFLATFKSSCRISNCAYINHIFAKVNFL